MFDLSQFISRLVEESDDFDTLKEGARLWGVRNPFMIEERKEAPWLRKKRQCSWY